MDVGVGIVFDVVVVMELGCDGVFMNIVIVEVKDLICMVRVMKLVVEVGCDVYLVGCMFKKKYVDLFLLFLGFI